MLNPEVKQWLIGVRDLLPRAQIRFTTNGLTMHDPVYWLDLFESIGNCVFKITVHRIDTILEEKIQLIMQSRQWKPVLEHGIHRWQGPNRVRFQINRPLQFLQTFSNSYHNMQPWDNDPKKSFDACIQKTCPLLYEGRLYKCSTSALRKPLLDRFGWPNQMQWLPYVDSGLGAECTEQELIDFVDNFGKPHTRCRQCPVAGQGQIDHLQTVVVKKAHFAQSG